MLEEVRKNYIEEAKRVVPNYQKLDVNKLCNLYVENENDEIKKSGYFAAIVLKKWGYIGRHYVDSKISGFSIEECYDMIIDAICYVLKARSWLNPKKKIYKDPQGPDKCLNMCIWSTRRRYYDLANMDKRKCNYGKYSLDTLQENVGDPFNLLSNENVLQSNDLSIEESTNLNLIVSNLLSNNKVMEGLIIDNICFDNCFSLVKRNDEIFNEFKLSKLINNLYGYNISTLRLISNKYAVDESKVIDILPVLNNNKNKLSRIVKNIIKRMNHDNILKENLCC